MLTSSLVSGTVQCRVSARPRPRYPSQFKLAPRLRLRSRQACTCSRRIPDPPPQLVLDLKLHRGVRRFQEIHGPPFSPSNLPHHQLLLVLLANNTKQLDSHPTEARA